MRVAEVEGSTAPLVYTTPRKGGDEFKALVERHSRNVLPLDAMLTLAGIATDDFAHRLYAANGEISPDLMAKQKFAFDMWKDTAAYMHGKQMTVKLDNPLDEHENALIRLAEAKKNMQTGIYEIENWDEGHDG